MRYLKRAMKLLLIACAGAALLGFLFLAWQDWLTGMLFTLLYLGGVIGWFATRSTRIEAPRPPPPPAFDWRLVAAQPPSRRHARNRDWVTPFIIGWIVGDWLFDDDGDGEA